MKITTKEQKRLQSLGINLPDPGRGYETLEDYFNEASCRCYIDNMKKAIAAGCDINAQDDRSGRSTPLMYAAGNHKKEMAVFLIANGADITLKDHWGRTAIDWAFEYKAFEMVRYLSEELTDQIKRGGVRAFLKGPSKTSSKKRGLQ